MLDCCKLQVKLKLNLIEIFKSTTPAFCTGDDCSQTADQGYWEVLHPKDIQPEGSASHCAVVWKDSLYIVGGESYHRAKMLYTYDFNGMFKYHPCIFQFLGSMFFESMRLCICSEIN